MPVIRPDATFAAVEKGEALRIEASRGKCRSNVLPEPNRWFNPGHVRQSTITGGEPRKASQCNTRRCQSEVPRSRSQQERRMANEVLCKIICHNICCLIQEAHELGISLEGLGQSENRKIGASQPESSSSSCA